MFIVRVRWSSLPRSQLCNGGWALVVYVGVKPRNTGWGVGKVKQGYLSVYQGSYPPPPQTPEAFAAGEPAEIEQNIHF